MELTAISDINQFMGIKDDWNNLLQASDCDNLFLRHEWLSSWWQSYGSKDELLVILLKKEGALIGGVPLMSTHDKLRGLPVNKIAFMGDAPWTVGDFLISENRVEVLEKIVEYLIMTKWDIIDFQNIPDGSKNVKFISDIFTGKGFHYLSMNSSVSPYIKTDLRWEEFLKNRPLRFRKSMRNKINKIEKSGEVTIRKYSTQEEINYALPVIFKISRNGWKYSEKKAMSSTDEDKSFYTCLSREMTNLGLLTIWILEFNGTPVAFEYQITFKKILHALVADYDLAFKDLSPGSVLDYHIMKNFNNSEAFEYDLGCGNSFYKTNWTDEAKKYCRIYIYRDTVYSRLLENVEKVIVPSIKQLREKVIKVRSWKRNQQPVF